jgi:hypothetical protein
MIQIITTIDEVFNHILNIVDCTISIPYEKFHSCDYTKHLDEVFPSNNHNYFEKKRFVEKLHSFQK